MDDQPGRFVDDQDVVVLVYDVEPDVGRRGEIEGDRFGDVEADLAAGGDERVGPDRDRRPPSTDRRR